MYLFMQILGDVKALEKSLQVAQNLVDQLNSAAMLEGETFGEVMGGLLHAARPIISRVVDQATAVQNAFKEFLGYAASQRCVAKT
jgi:2-hydroxy-3-keto-5-methylthiopentenyl-1-phosphate phosphatase